MDFFHSRQNRAALIIALLGIAIVIAVSPFVSGLLGAAVLYVMCAPVYQRLRRIMNADLAAAITLVGAIVVIALPFTWIVLLVADQLPSAIQSARDSDFFARLSVLRLGRIRCR